MSELTGLLASLERYARYPTQDALRGALTDLIGARAVPPAVLAVLDAASAHVLSGDPASAQKVTMWARGIRAQQAAAQASDQLLASLASTPAWEWMVAWADERLEHWHELKAQAIHSCFNADPTGTNHQLMLAACVNDLRAGLEAHPELLPDALALQQMASAGLLFGKAIDDLRAEGLPLPADPQHLIAHQQVATHAFRVLLGEREVGAPVA